MVYFHPMSDEFLTKAERTRRFIIEKAAPIFNQKGYAGTSLSDLAEASGLTKGAIYGNFKDKDEVAVCAFRYNLDFIRSFLRREMDGVENHVEKLLVYPRTFRKMYRPLLENGGCPILNTVTEADDTHPTLHRLAVEAIDIWRDRIVGLIDAGKRAGKIAPDTDPRTAAEIVISLLEGGTLLAKATGEESYLLSAVDQAETLIESIRTPLK